MKNLDAFRNKLKSGVVNFKYTKKDGSVREAKGTLNPETFEATLRFTAKLAEMCKNTTAIELSKMTFDDLLGNNPVIRSYWERALSRTKEI